LIRYFFHWYSGAIWSNILASLIWTLPAGIVGVVAWRHRMCKVFWCHRIGQHPVRDTTWKLCSRHHRPEHHVRARTKHAVKHPDRLGHGDMP
jgi:hypothetical protein